MLATISLAAAAGCQSQAKPQRIDQSVWESPRGVVTGTTGPIVVAEGPLPLVYQAIQPGAFHVTDATTHSQIARLDLRALEIVRVDNRGVFVAERRISSTALSKDHQYNVYLDPPPDQQGVHWENRQQGFGP